MKLIRFKCCNKHVTDAAYELALSYLTSTNGKGRPVQDERLLCQKIYNRLASISSQDADKFTESYAKLKNSVRIIENYHFYFFLPLY